ncbi:hypothetical protein pb186bvf_004536 [Paramecium bursaria]
MCIFNKLIIHYGISTQYCYKEIDMTQQSTFIPQVVANIINNFYYQILISISSFLMGQLFSFNHYINMGLNQFFHQLVQNVNLPIDQNISQLYYKAHAVYAKKIQILVYYNMVKSIIIISTTFMDCIRCKDFMWLDVWAIQYILYILIQLYIFRNLKLQLGDFQKQIILSQEFSELYDQQLQQNPSHKEINEMINKIKLQAFQDDPKLQCLQKVLLSYTFMLIIEFVWSFFTHHSDGQYINLLFGCQNYLQQVCLYMFIVMIFEYYQFIVLLVLSLLFIPIFLGLYLYKKAKKLYQILKLKKQLLSFQTKIYQITMDGWTISEPECSICMQEYREGEKIMKLPCSNLHVYHEECIKNWLNISVECPTCRKVLIDHPQQL